MPVIISGTTGIQGNLQGNVTGNLTGNVTGNLNQLGSITNPAPNTFHLNQNSTGQNWNASTTWSTLTLMEIKG